MPPASALDVLIQSARDARDTMARRLADGLGEARAAEQRLALLEGYRRDYEAGFRQSATAGLSSAAWQNYRRFLGQLDAAIETQRRELQERQLRTERGRLDLDAARARLAGFERLSSRREESERLSASRTEQKLSDESNLRRLHAGAKGH